MLLSTLGDASKMQEQRAHYRLLEKNMEEKQSLLHHAYVLSSRGGG
jgi:hypothetical protein